MKKKEMESEFGPFLGGLIVGAQKTARNTAALSFLIGVSVGGLAIWLWVH
jgi:hypothetical protein